MIPLRGPVTPEPEIVIPEPVIPEPQVTPDPIEIPEPEIPEPDKPEEVDPAVRSRFFKRGIVSVGGLQPARATKVEHASRQAIFEVRSNTIRLPR